MVYIDFKCTFSNKCGRFFLIGNDICFDICLGLLERVKMNVVYMALFVMDKQVMFIYH